MEDLGFYAMRVVFLGAAIMLLVRSGTSPLYRWPTVFAGVCLGAFILTLPR